MCGLARASLVKLTRLLGPYPRLAKLGPYRKRAAHTYPNSFRCHDPQYEAAGTSYLSTRRDRYNPRSFMTDYALLLSTRPRITNHTGQKRIRLNVLNVIIYSI